MQEPTDQSKSSACEDTEVEGNCAEPNESTEVECSCAEPNESTEVECSCEEDSEDTEAEGRCAEVNEECSCLDTGDICRADCDVDADCDEGDDCPVPEASVVEETIHPDCPPNTKPYTIASGDTLFSLAQRRDTTVEAIIGANPGIDPDHLRIGQVICIPADNAHPVCPEGTYEYTIERGDTLFDLAQRYNITVDAIIGANPGIDPDRLRIGQVICIPGDNAHPVCPEGTYEYTIERGDTLFHLARYYNITVDAILRANPGIDPDRLRIGQVICIPRGTEARHEPECPVWTTPYEVRAGETLFQIANRNRLTLEDVLGANPHLTDPDLLEVGQIICLPDDE